jgi:tetratricopeptide (TPR) repeat protein
MRGTRALLPLAAAAFAAVLAAPEAFSQGMGGMQGGEGSAAEAQTRRTPAMRERVYTRLAEAQECAEMDDLECAQQRLAQVREMDDLNSYELAQMWNFYAFIYFGQDNYREAIRAYEMVLQQPDLPLGMEGLIHQGGGHRREPARRANRTDSGEGQHPGGHQRGERDLDRPAARRSQGGAGQHRTSARGEPGGFGYYSGRQAGVYGNAGTTTMYTLCQLYFQQERYDDSLGMLDRWFALSEDPGAEPYVLRAQIFYSLQRYREGIEPVRTAIQINQDLEREPQERRHGFRSSGRRFQRIDCGQRGLKRLELVSVAERLLLRVGGLSQRHRRAQNHDRDLAQAGIFRPAVCHVRAGRL